MSHYIDLTGRRINHLTVLSYAGKKGKDILWNCRCDCGNITVIKGRYLMCDPKFTKFSCGCQTRPRPITDITGRKYSRLTVLKFDHITKSGHTFWLCRCDCGKEKVIARTHLESGSTKSCGCLRDDIEHHIIAIKNRPTKPYETKFGKFYSNSPLVKTHLRMVSRCYNPADSSYHRYGEIGISIDKRWYDPSRVQPNSRRDDIGVINFIEDTYEEYCEFVQNNPNTVISIDRIDGKRGYSKDNCRWSTWVMQNNNLSSNRHIYDGQEVLTFSQCVKKYIPEDCITGSYSGRVANLISTKLAGSWTVDQVLLYLRHFKETGEFLSKKDTYDFVYRKIDQSIVYKYYPNEERLPGYETI